MTEATRNSDELKPRFLGFTGGVKEGESMADFCRRINEESGS
jgi:hypothetical protein